MSVESRRRELERALSEAEGGRYEEIWIEPDTGAMIDARKALADLVAEVERANEGGDYAILAGIDQRAEYEKAKGQAA